MISQTVKDKIGRVVKEYERVFPLELKTFQEGHRQKVKIQSNKFSLVKGSQLDARHVYEVPETLFVAILKNLSEGELNEFQSKDGANWFARQFDAFRIAEKI